MVVMMAASLGLHVLLQLGVYSLRRRQVAGIERASQAAQIGGDGIARRGRLRRRALTLVSLLKRGKCRLRRGEISRLQGLSQTLEVALRRAGVVLSVNRRIVVVERIDAQPGHRSPD